MFHTLITLAYLIPGIYLFIRIWQLFIKKEHRGTYLIIFLVLYLIYPLGNFFGERAGSTGILESVSNYLLPFFLYLFLFVLLADLLLLLNRLIRFIPVHRIRSGKYDYLILAGIGTLSATVVILGIINFNTIRTTEYQISIPAGTSDIKKLKLAFVSDFHLQENVPVGFVENFRKKTEDIKPDILLFGGDIVEGDPDDGKLEQFEKIISGIRTKYGVYGVLGNHEHYSRQDQGDFFVRSGIEILRDTIKYIGHSFAVAGRNDGRISSRPSAAELLKDVSDSLPVILLDHLPTELDQISRTTADVLLSGHTHHGQMFPINLITEKVYEISYGYLKKKNTHCFVSSGIRLWGFPVRTTAKSEILVIDIAFE